MDQGNVQEYLERFHQRRFIKESGLLKTNSPFSRDSNPSFVVYPAGDWYDFSTAQGGDYKTLLRLLGDTSNPKTSKWVPLPPKKPMAAWDNIIPSEATNLSEEEILIVRAYATSRRILKGYLPGCYFEAGNRKLGLLFPHLSIDGKIIGGKFRNVASTGGGDRFRVRGHLGFYILPNLIGGFEKPTIYLVESETSANSFWEFCKSSGRNCVVISCGANSTVPRNLPYPLDGKVIIDYDFMEDEAYPPQMRKKFGTNIAEKIYQERVKKFSHLGLTPVKLMLRNKEDINGLWIQNKTSILETLL